MVDKAKKNKRQPNSNSRILGNAKAKPKKLKPAPVYSYFQQQTESTAVDAVFNQLFNKLTEVK